MDFLDKLSDEMLETLGEEKKEGCVFSDRIYKELEDSNKYQAKKRNRDRLNKVLLKIFKDEDLKKAIEKYDQPVKFAKATHGPYSHLTLNPYDWMTITNKDGFSNNTVSYCIYECKGILYYDRKKGQTGLADYIIQKTRIIDGEQIELDNQYHEAVLKSLEKRIKKAIEDSFII